MSTERKTLMIQCYKSKNRIENSKILKEHAVARRGDNELPSGGKLRADHEKREKHLGNKVDSAQEMIRKCKAVTTDLCQKIANRNGESHRLSVEQDQVTELLNSLETKKAAMKDTIGDLMKNVNIKFDQELNRLPDLMSEIAKRLSVMRVCGSAEKRREFRVRITNLHKLVEEKTNEENRASEEIDNLSNLLPPANADNTGTKEENEKMNTEDQLLKTQVDASRNTLSGLKGDSASAEASHADAYQKLEEHCDQLEKLKSEQQSQDEEISQSLMHIEEVRNSCAALKGKMEQMQNDVWLEIAKHKLDGAMQMSDISAKTCELGQQLERQQNMTDEIGKEVENLTTRELELTRNITEKSSGGAAEQVMNSVTQSKETLRALKQKLEHKQCDLRACEEKKSIVERKTEGTHQQLELREKAREGLRARQQREQQAKLAAEQAKEAAFLKKEARRKQKEEELEKKRREDETLKKKRAEEERERERRNLEEEAARVRQQQEREGRAANELRASMEESRQRRAEEQRYKAESKRRQTEKPKQQPVQPLDSTSAKKRDKQSKINNVLASKRAEFEKARQLSQESWQQAENERQERLKDNETKKANPRPRSSLTQPLPTVVEASQPKPTNRQPPQIQATDEGAANRRRRRRSSDNTVVTESEDDGMMMDLDDLFGEEPTKKTTKTKKVGEVVPETPSTIHPVPRVFELTDPRPTRKSAQKRPKYADDALFSPERSSSSDTDDPNITFDLRYAVTSTPMVPRKKSAGKPRGASAPRGGRGRGRGRSTAPKSNKKDYLF